MNHPATTVYTKPACVQCDSTKRALNRRGVTYTEVDLTKDESALKYVKGLGHLGAPVIVVDTTTAPAHWYGFNPPLIDLHFGKAA